MRDRIPIAVAARKIGVSREHVLKLGQDGVLDVFDARRPGAKRGVWTVTTASVESFLAVQHRDPRADRARGARLAPEISATAGATIDDP